MAFDEEQEAMLSDADTGEESVHAESIARIIVAVDGMETATVRSTLWLSLNIYEPHW